MRLLWSLELAAGLAFGASAAVFAAVDTDAAEALMKKSDCFKCHAVDRDKKASSYKKLAAKHKGKPDAEDKLFKQLTTNPKVKFEDGTEEEHKSLKTTDNVAIKNVLGWILAQ